MQTQNIHAYCIAAAALVSLPYMAAMLLSYRRAQRLLNRQSFYYAGKARPVKRRLWAPLPKWPRQLGRIMSGLGRLRSRHLFTKKSIAS